MPLKLRTLIFLAIISYTPLLTSIVMAAQDANNKVIPVAQGEKIERLGRAINRQQVKLQETQKKERSLFDELKDLDKKLEDQQNKIQEFQDTLLRQEAFLLEKEHALSLISEDKKRAEVHIKKRLLAFYQTGDFGLVNALFSAQTLPDLINMREYFHYLFTYDRRVIRNYRIKLDLLASARQEILAEKEKLLSTIVKIREQEQELIDSRIERQTLLTKVQTEEELYRRALEEMEESASRLSSTLKKYKRPQIRPTKRKRALARKSVSHQPEAVGFSAQKGKLLPPVNNATVVVRFNESQGRFGTQVHSNGLDYSVKGPSQVKAVYEGTVVYVGELKGYGKTVIIDHGQQYFSLVCRLKTILTANGEYVKTGQIIGSIHSSGQSSLMGHGLHFEIRHGSTPEDPTPWLQKY